MAEGLVLTENENFAKVCSLNLQIYAGVDCLYSSKENCINLFKELIPFLEILIVDPWIQEANILGQLDSYFLEISKFVPTIVTRPKKFSTTNNCFYYIEDKSVKNIINTTGRILKITARDMHAKKLPDYIPLNINYFKDLTKAPCDIYLRDGDGDSGYSYFQIYEKGQNISSADIYTIQIEEKRVNLYIPKEERLKFANNYTNEIILKFGNFKK